jgi:glucose-6-phosphate isomerase
VEAAAGLAVFGGSPASARRELVADGTPGRLAGKDPTLWGTAAEAIARHRLGWVDGYRRSRELLPQVAELSAELADLDEIVVPAPATAAAAITRSLGVPMTVLASDPRRLRDAIADPDRLGRTLVVLTGDGAYLRDTFWPAYLDSGLSEAEASRHFVAVTVAGSALERSARALGVLVLPADPEVSGAFGALTASTLVPAALAGVDVAELLDQAELLAPALAGDTVNPALALGLALTSSPGLIALVNDGTGFEGLGDWAAELLAAAGLRAIAVDDPGIEERTTSGVLTISYGGALSYGGGPPLGRGPILGSGRALGGGPGLGGGPALGGGPGSAGVPGGGVRPDVAVNGPLGAQFLAWQYGVAIAAAALGCNPFSDNCTAAHS